MATLTLNVAGQPGVDDLTVIDGLYIDATQAPAQFPMTASPAFEIRVGGE